MAKTLPYTLKQIVFLFSGIMESKRSIIPQGDTPGKPSQKVIRCSDSSSRKALFVPPNVGNSDNKVKHGQTYSWTRKQLSDLVEFIALFWDHTSSASHWPQFKNDKFWTSCAKLVAEDTKAELRSVNAVRSKVVKYLSITFGSIGDVEEHFGIDYMHDTHNVALVSIRDSETHPSLTQELLYQAVFHRQLQGILLYS